MGATLRALVVTISDGVAHGTREDASGDALQRRLTELGFDVERQVVPDEMEHIAGAVSDASGHYRLVVTTGGTGLGPRDRTPQTLHALLDYEIPGFGELMRGFGRTQDAARRPVAQPRRRARLDARDRRPGLRVGCHRITPGDRATPRSRARNARRAHAARGDARLMVEHIPLYPLAPLLFLAAVVLFALLMARHLRVFAYARPAAISADDPGRLRSVLVLHDCPGAHVPRPRRGDHARDDLLGLRHPDRRHGRPDQLRPDPHARGLAVRRLAVAAAAAEPEPLRAGRAG